jgi:heat shock protein HslJ
MRNRPVAVLGCLIALLAGCAEAGEQGGDPTGIAWELTEGTVDGQPVPIVDGHGITLSLTDEGVGGTAACNGYGGMYEIAGDQITFSELFGTEMACTPEAVMESEQTYLRGLLLVDTFSMTDENLTLSGEGVELVFAALPPVPTADLTGTVWVLESLVDQDSVSSVGGERATLELFSDNSMIGSTGCRGLHGRYETTGADVTMPELAAEGDCPPDLEAQDSHVISVLGDGFRASVEGQVLNLSSSGGLGLVYRAEP